MAPPPASSTSVFQLDVDVVQIDDSWLVLLAEGDGGGAGGKLHGHRGLPDHVPELGRRVDDRLPRPVVDPDHATGRGLRPPLLLATGGRVAEDRKSVVEGEGGGRGR